MMMDIFAGDIEIDLPPDDEDPHVRVVGDPEAVRLAGAMVRQELEPRNKVTMKLDVSWTHHSHIIGKGGNIIQPVVKRTGVSIHFPDGNKNSQIRKSNQVSINSRGEELSGLEEARGCIRDLTPLIFTFTLSASAQFINVSDPTVLIQHVQNTYQVQVDLKVTDDIPIIIIGTVRGNEFDAAQVKEATLCILKAYCNNLAPQMPVQVMLEISPQHHAFVLGRNNETIKRIMQRTATKISFPDSNDVNVPPLKKSTVVISGAIDNVYLARQNILGALPIVLMFDLMPDNMIDPNEVSQIMKSMDVNIIIKNKRVDGRRLVVIKGAEKNAGNIYEVWHLLTKADKDPPKARIPPNYHIPEAAPLYGLSMSLADLNLGHWLGDSSCGSPTSVPVSQGHSSSFWGGGLPMSGSQIPSYLPRSHYDPHMLDPTSSCYASNYLLRNGGLDSYNNNCILPMMSPGKRMNLNSLMSGMSVMSVSHNDISCGTSSNSGSSISSPVPSPRDPSPDQIITNHNSGPLQYTDLESSSSKTGMKALSVMMTDIERRAPGCEKKRLELEHQKLTSLSDYTSKKMQAAKAMKEQVSTGPRTPTSNWSGYGFSKSMPGFMIRQKMQENKLLQTNQVELDKWENWQPHDPEVTEFPSCQAISNIPYTSHLSQLSANLGSGESGLTLQRTPVSFSASIDCGLTRPRETTTGSSTHLDIPSILTDIQLEQYIDVFAAQEVDLPMFLALTDTDLKELGIKIFGHRKRILMVIKDLSIKKPLFAGRLNQSIQHATVLREGTSPWD